MLSFDTNIAVIASNASDPRWKNACEFFRKIQDNDNVVICELMLVELYLKLCNAKIFPNPYSPREAAEICQTYRDNRSWKLVESAPVMEYVWLLAARPNFAFRRIIDVRFGLTLRHYGVTDLATANVKDFQNLGFAKVWDPTLA